MAAVRSRSGVRWRSCTRRWALPRLMLSTAAAITSAGAVLTLTRVSLPGSTITQGSRRRIVSVSMPSQASSASRCGAIAAGVGAVPGGAGMLDPQALRSACAMRSALSLGRPACSHSRVMTRICASGVLPAASTSLRRFQRACASVIVPDRKASTPSASAALLLSRSAARNDDNRASASGTAQGSPRWSTPPPRAFSRASSRRISRAQSSAPDRIQAACVRARSAPSTWIARHCCQTMPAAIVATRVRISIASSRAAPRWRWRVVLAVRPAFITSAARAARRASGCRPRPRPRS